MGGRIVVGIDGSEHAQRALRWALEDAAFRDAEVEVVHVYEAGPSWSVLDPEREAAIPDEHVIEEREAASLKAAEEQARADAERILADIDPAREVAVRVSVVNAEQPAAALIGHAKGADLLVVGARGRGGFAGLLLGSVSQHCVRHAPCPVVVVRRPGDET